MFVGVDVSMHYIDLHPIGVGVKPARIRNKLSSIQTIADYYPPGTRFLMESTGVYHLPLARWLYMNGYIPYVVNPFRVKKYADSLLVRNKTDSVDASLLAEYCYRYHSQLRPYVPLSETFERFSAVVRFAEGLTRSSASAKQRLNFIELWDKSLADTLSRVTFDLDAQRNGLYSMAERIMREDDLLLGWYSRIIELPGFGPRNTLSFLAHAGDMRRFRDEHAFAAYTGLTPRRYQSGAYVGVSRISRVGDPKLRWALCLAAATAVRVESPYRVWYSSLVTRGKPRKVGITAVAHKLARHAWLRAIKPRD